MAAPSTPAAGLTPAQLAAFQADGFLVIDSWWTPEQVSNLKSTIDRMLRDFEVPKKVTVFTTSEQAHARRDEYFLSSGDKVCFFFEEKAFNEEGELIRPKELCINKIGHNLHELVPAFKEVSFDPRITSILRSLGYKRPVVPQSMYICKQPGIGGEVRPHQDGTFLYTTPQSVIGLWWPLEDCTTRNGCLWAVPGSHTTGVRRRFKRTAVGSSTEFEPAVEEKFDLTGAVPLETKAGSLVLLHHAVVHYSEANESHASRHAYSIHVVEGTPDVVYPKDNWLQREGGAPFPPLYDDLPRGMGSGDGGADAKEAEAARAVCADT